MRYLKFYSSDFEIEIEASNKEYEELKIWALDSDGENIADYLPEIIYKIHSAMNIQLKQMRYKNLKITAPDFITDVKMNSRDYEELKHYYKTGEKTNAYEMLFELIGDEILRNENAEN